MRGVFPRGARLLALLFVVGVAQAAPEATYLFPAGGQRGQKLVVTVGGKAPKWPAQVWVDRPGVQVAAREKQGELDVTIAPDAPLGVYWLRLYDADGAAAPRPFVVGGVAEAGEREPNGALAEAQSFDGSPTAVLVNGQLGKSGDVDVFVVPARAGQTLVADFDAQFPLGSPVDAVLQLVSPEGFVAAQSEDQQGLDPRLAFPIDRDGNWRVRVFGFPSTPNQTIGLAGDDSFVYRLTLTTGAFVDFAAPLAVQRGASTKLALAGWNLPPELALLDVQVADDATSVTLEHPALANSLRLPALAHECLAPTESADDAPREVSMPVTITGAIASRGRRDRYEFAAKAGEIISARIESRGLGFELDPVLALSDVAGKSLVRVDDSPGTRDAQLVHTAAADGLLTLAVTDLHRGGGPRFAYRLTLERGAADFRSASEAQAVELPRGGTASVAVAIERLHGHAEPIHYVAEGLPAGVTAAEVVSAPTGDAAAKVTLQLAAAADAALASGPIRIVGRDAKGVSRVARLAGPGGEAGLVELWLTVREAAK